MQQVVCCCRLEIHKEDNAMKQLFTKHLVMISALTLLTAGVGRATDQQTQAFLGVFAETSQNRMAGMAMPKINIPDNPNIPPEIRARLAGMGGGPQRKLTVRLWTPGIAPDDATASLEIPDGLKLGQKLDLDLYRPKPVEGAASGVEQPGTPASIDTDFVIKRYWGSSETVKPGQPDVVSIKDLTGDQKAAMRQKSMQAQQAASSSYFYKPDWTTGYWPKDRQPGTIAAGASLVGHYALTSSYSGNVAIDVPETVNFLDAIEMTSPQLDQVVPLDKAMLFRWKNVPNALGFHATITGFMREKKTMIIWTSSEIKTDVGMSMDYLQMSEVKDLVAKTVFMSGDRVDVAVPAGIFDGCDVVSMMMVGYGPGTALDKGQPLPRVQSKTTLTINLGGAMMKRGNRPGGFRRPGGDPQ